MSELTGHPQLTPYRGGWCGNEMFPEVITGALRAKAAGLIRRLGDRLGAAGYRGFFEVDVLVDTDTDEVYLGELNPRISGASAITNVTAGAYADVPLFAFHLLEFMDVDFDFDVDEINERWEELAAADVWSQMIIKETSPVVERIDAAAPDRPVLPGRRRRAGLPAGGAGLASAAERVRGVLPAHLRPRRLPLEGRRPGRPGDQGAAADRLAAAGHRRSPSGPGTSSTRSAASTPGRPWSRPRPRPRRGRAASPCDRCRLLITARSDLA